MNHRSHRWTRLTLETLESRELLSVSPNGMDLPVANGTIWIVDTLADAVLEDDYTSLREAIANAAAGDTITFDSSLAGGTITLGGTELSVSQSLTIDAFAGLTKGITVNANHTSRVFHITGGTEANLSVELKGLTITGGSADDGGGIYAYSTALTLTNCAVVGNRANGTNGSGGGIYASEGLSLTLINCTVAGNTASHGGGIDTNCPTTLKNSIVSENDAVSSKNIDGDGEVTYGADSLVDCASVGFRVAPLFENGVLTNLDTMNLHLKSGSVAIDAGNNNDVATEVDLDGNPRINYGTVDIGAYEAQRETASTVVTTLLDIVDAYDQQISLREAMNVYSKTGDTITFDSSLDGGTITLGGTELSVGKSLTIDALTGLTKGIAIHANQKSLAFYIKGGTAETPVELKGLTITGGSADDGGGFFVDEGSVLKLVNCVVAENQANYYGGGIYAYSADLTLTDCTISGNQSNYGGGIFAFSTKLTMTNGAVSNNTTLMYGGGVFAYGATTLTNCAVSGNTAGYGGGVYTHKDCALTLTNCAFSGNTANYYGGGIYASQEGTLALSNCTVAGNTANTSGGGIFTHSVITLANSIVTENFATNNTNIYGAFSPSCKNNLINSDPQFVEAPIFDENGALTNPTTIDLHLKEGSWAINSGDNSAVSSESDLDGNSRIVGETVDLGAYEYQLPVTQEEKSLVVTTIEDVVDATDQQTSLREAILFAETESLGRTITFDSSLGGTTLTLSNGVLMITKGIAIDASALTDGITIDANAKSRVFEIHGGTEETPVELKGLSITGGSASYGCGIYAYSSAILKLTNCTVSKNTANGSNSYGAGIYADDDSKLTLTNCTVSENMAFYGGGIFAYKQSAFTLTNSVVIMNMAVIGGGIYAYTDSALTLANSAVSGNSADYYGGGIYAYTDSTLTLANSAVSWNSANYYGGGIDLLSAALDMSNCILLGNRANNGGGTFSYNGDMTLTNCTVCGNTASFGGGIFNDSGSLTLTNSIVSQNAATAYRNICGILSSSSKNNLINSDPQFVEAPVFENGVMTNSTTVDLHLKGTSGAIDFGDSSAVSSEYDLDGNPRIVGGTVDLGVYEYQEEVEQETKSLVVTTTDDVIDPTDHQTSLREAILYAETESLGRTITFDSSLAGKTITISGGAFFITKGIVIDASALTEGLAIDANTTSGLFEIQGGTEETPVELKGLTMTGANAYYGGGLYAYEGSVILLTNCTVTGNSAGFGGGIYTVLGSAVTLANCEVSKNSAVSGGAIVAGGALTLTNSTVMGNSATDGGGIDARQGSTLTLTNSTVTRNIAENGGGIYSGGALTLTDCEISWNTAKGNGAGINTYQGSTLTLTNCTVTRNTASGNGSGIFGYDFVTLTDCAVTENTAKGNGGGIFVYGALTLINCTVLENTAGSRGGGIFTDGALTLTDCTVCGNTVKSAFGQGGGIFSLGTLTLTNSVVSKNYAPSNKDIYRTDTDKTNRLVNKVSNGFSIAPAVENGVLASLESNALPLTTRSAAIDMEKNAATTDLETDLNGDARIDPTAETGIVSVDLNPDENPPETASTVVTTLLNCVDRYDYLISFCETIAAYFQANDPTPLNRPFTGGAFALRDDEDEDDLPQANHPSLTDENAIFGDPTHRIFEILDREENSMIHSLSTTGAIALPEGTRDLILADALESYLEASAFEVQ